MIIIPSRGHLNVPPQWGRLGFNNLHVRNWLSLQHYQIDEFAQKRRNSIANALELRLSCTNPSKWRVIIFIDGFVQQIRNSIANALGLRLSCTNPSKWRVIILAALHRYPYGLWTAAQRSDETAPWHWLTLEEQNIQWDMPSSGDAAFVDTEVFRLKPGDKLEQHSPLCEMRECGIF